MLTTDTTQDIRVLAVHTNSCHSVACSTTHAIRSSCPIYLTFFSTFLSCVGHFAQGRFVYDVIILRAIQPSATGVCRDCRSLEPTGDALSWVNLSLWVELSFLSAALRLIRTRFVSHLLVFSALNGSERTASHRRLHELRKAFCPNTGFKNGEKLWM